MTRKGEMKDLDENRRWENRWEKKKKLGEGGQGTVWLVELIQNVKPNEAKIKAVLKLLKRNQNIQARGRMVYEVANLKLLAEKGGHVPRVLEDNLDYFNEQSIPLYFIMEWIEGDTLTKYIRSCSKLPIDEAIVLLKSLCSTIKQAHANNIVHRDIKPDNIIVRTLHSESVLFVIDFGLSFNENTQETLTRIKEAVGNTFLILPESMSLGGNRRSIQSDVTYLVGVFYFMITGEYPGSLGGELALPPHRRHESTFRKLLKHDSRYRNLELFFDRGFRYEVDYRFFSVEELEAALEELKSAESSAIVSQQDLQWSSEIRVLFNGAEPLVKFAKLFTRGAMLGFREDLIQWLDSYLSSYMKYCGLLAETLVDSDKRNLDENDGDTELDLPSWPEKVIEAAKLVDQLGNALPRHRLTSIECQAIADIFEVLVHQELECVLKKEKNCLSNEDERLSVFRRHSGAMNYYYIGKVLQRTSDDGGPLYTPFIPKIYRFISEHRGTVCWRCGGF